MTRRALPAIFGKHRFAIPAAMQPTVIFCVSKAEEDEAQAFVDARDDEAISNEHFGRWWVEYQDLGILAAVHGERSYSLQAFGKRSGPQPPFIFYDDGLQSSRWWKMADIQRVTAGLYMKAAVLLSLYTDREANVSVNTLTRKAPAIWRREGDSLRFVRAESLASLSGMMRQRDYERPQEHSGIRMREHDVRGHWRTYASGVRVWVRAHKRGDAALGQVTRVIA